MCQCEVSASTSLGTFSVCTFLNRGSHLLLDILICCWLALSWRK